MEHGSCSMQCSTIHNSRNKKIVLKKKKSWKNHAVCICVLSIYSLMSFNVIIHYSDGCSMLNVII